MAHDVGQEELVSGAVQGKSGVHEAACGENADADDSDEAHVKPLHQQRNERNDEQLRQAGPGKHKPDLLGIVALHLPEVLGQDVDGTEQCDAHQYVDQNADAEVALLQKA